MIERSVADIVAELRGYKAPGNTYMYGDYTDLTNAAADMLEHLAAKVKRLDTELDRTNERWLDLRVELERHDALRPPCPTCKGKKRVFSRMLDLGLGDGPEEVTVPCPENGGKCDGRVSWERIEDD